MHAFWKAQQEPKSLHLHIHPAESIQTPDESVCKNLLLEKVDCSDTTLRGVAEPHHRVSTAV